MNESVETLLRRPRNMRILGVKMLWVPVSASSRLHSAPDFTLVKIISGFCTTEQGEVELFLRSSTIILGYCLESLVVVTY